VGLLPEALQPADAMRPCLSTSEFRMLRPSERKEGLLERERSTRDAPSLAGYIFLAGRYFCEACGWDFSYRDTARHFCAT
jgi:hypothetical protein